MISPNLSKIECKWGHSMAGYVLLLYDIARRIRRIGGRTKNKVILEIGLHHGASTNSFLLGIADSRNPELTHLYTIDIRDSTKLIDRFLGKEAFDKLRPYWTFIHGDSKEVEWDKEIDVLLIDGDHSYEGAKADYEKYVPFVHKGGLILMHDVTHAGCQGVKKLWDEIKLPKIMFLLSKSGMGIIVKE